MVQIRQMTESDVALGMRLKTQAGWNQLPADWRRFIAMEPAGCFVASVDGRDLGTATTCDFNGIAWIAMVLVDEISRGQGVGKALLNHALQHLDAVGCDSIRLDATSLGRPLYEKLGFVAQFEIIRFAGEPIGSTFLNSPSETDDESLFAIDRDVMHTDRRKLLARLFDEHRNNLRTLGDAFLTSRPGESAIQIGPCVGGAESGASLLRDAMARHAGRRVYIDVPAENAQAVAIVRDAGLTEQRKLTRMTRGRAILEDIPRLWASSGPEKG